VAHASYIKQTLSALGFKADDSGTWRPPAGADITLASIGTFFELRIVLPGGAVVTAVLSERALVVKP
jgi:hypothetical protein